MATSTDTDPQAAPQPAHPSPDAPKAWHSSLGVQVQAHDFDSAALTAALRARTAGRAGAVVTFTGYVRDFSPEHATHTLFLEHYPGMCERVLAEIIDQARQRWDVQDAIVTHRVGELARADQIVFVAVASAHRGDAFQACAFIMDALKTRAPFWKRETLADGAHFWVEARASDAERASRWDTHDSAPHAADRPSPSPYDTRDDGASAPATPPSRKDQP